MLSLKAELLRKQNEVSQAKSRQAAQPFVPKSFEKANNQKNQSIESTKSVTVSAKKTIELEDNEQLERSKRILEAKSKFYDRMAASGGAVNSDDNCLVMFNVKKQTERGQYSSSESDDEEEYTADNKDENEDDWVEYTDSLGRTRRCLKTDLKLFKERDRALGKDLAEDSTDKVRVIKC